MFLTCKQVLPHMERQGNGAIVNIASVSGIRWLGVPYISYAATKAAVIQFTRVIALQCARSGIRANSILPEMMNTPMVHATEVIAAYGGSHDVVFARGRGPGQSVSPCSRSLVRRDSLINGRWRLPVEPGGYQLALAGAGGSLALSLSGEFCW
jgi:NAD(P)-dependent dehydrogenase (short-subunit alcohol dehydrogenase family)